jgi:hypothetical protein
MAAFGRPHTAFPGARSLADGGTVEIILLIIVIAIAVGLGYALVQRRRARR